jgi:UDP-2-acetamido-2-deoxy-ribo-hexuluronate aminotransferase
MDTIQCAIVLAKLERFDWEIEQRQAVAGRYNDLIQSTLPEGEKKISSLVHSSENGISSSLREGREDSSLSLRGGRQPDVAIQGDHHAIQTVKLRPDRTSVFAQYTILIDNREALQQHLNDAGIPTAIHYPIPLNEQPAYQHLCCPGCTPIAQQISKQVMSLPMSPDLTPEDQESIVEALLT